MKSAPSAFARLRATAKVARAQAGSFERSIPISIITDPKLEQRIATVLNTGSKILFNRHFLRQVADGSGKLHDILVLELARAVTITLGKRARSGPHAEPASADSPSQQGNRFSHAR